MAPEFGLVAAEADAEPMAQSTSPHWTQSPKAAHAAALSPVGCLEIEESDVAVIPLFDGSRNGWSHIPSGLFVAGRGGSQAFALYSESAPTPDCAKGWGASYIELNEPYRNTFHRDDQHGEHIPGNP